ncbi:Nucleotide-binding universal stress protein, UspA family [Halorientalis persicus]|jgi:nucleotide-binding universal stress UspA family protein|uniref:Nucleotide-binding universal stress protein, UspA family n=1 Tax=Halorientalis persicus TaxID=1367881 RepID=A0A1H8DYF6_9EURY|nr:universal stress protein [Halorientalis persicus]SEN11578.1 Nucleotide-binding universal stress protein, UspA family [Halorientalis persicus]
MYEILMPIDTDTDRALRQARAVEDLPGGSEDVHVTVLHSFTDNPSGASITQLQSARRAESHLEDAGYSVTLDERSGSPADAILDVAAEDDVDLICIGGRKRSPTGKVLFGSVTQSVLLDADRSVLVCRRDADA